MPLLFDFLVAEGTVAAELERDWIESESVPQRYLKLGIAQVVGTQRGSEPTLLKHQ